MEIYYVNGFFKHRNEALISVEDRGFNFSDGVYELISFANKNLIFLEKHFCSLKSIQVCCPAPVDGIRAQDRPFSCSSASAARVAFFGNSARGRGRRDCPRSSRD